MEASKNPSGPKLIVSTVRGTLSQSQIKRVPAIFYCTEAGSEPVRMKGLK